MFGSNKNKEDNSAKPAKKAGASPINALNSIVQGTTIEGDIKSDADIRIDGVIKGTITCNAKVIVGPTGLVEGSINCKNAMVEGRFEGTLHVKELLNVRETAEINGEIFTKKLIVQSGAVFNVTCKMGNQDYAAAGKPTSSAKKIEKPVNEAEGKKKAG